MRKQLALAVWLIVALLLLLPLQRAYAGEGPYDEGSPDKLTLNTVFQFDVSPDFNPNSDWEGTFNRASELLYNATDGQLQIGTVNFYNNCPQAYDQADVLIHSGDDGASANVSGLGTPGLHANMYHDTHTQNVASARGHFGLTHELGHYVFGLYDEYKNEAGDPSSCISPDSTIASIMDGGTTVQPNNQRTEWALPADQAACENTVQFERRGMVDWPWIIEHVDDRYDATLTQPMTYTTAMPAGHEALTFNYYECKVRAVVTIDRSGSMSGEPLATAKEGANLFVDLTEASDDLGVASFASSASVNYAIDVMTDTNKAAAQAAINGLVASGSTNIGGGLQTSLNMITGEGDPVSNEVVVLLSDGQHNTGIDPDSVIPALQARGVTVYTIGLGSGADAELMSRLASETGGTYFFAADSSGLAAHFNSIFTELRNDGLITALSEEIAANESVSHTIPMDSYTTAGGQATFVLAWDSG
ncbi:MAG: vWA domain-containing protein, partial [Ardenticatenaceae bacterium]